MKKLTTLFALGAITVGSVFGSSLTAKADTVLDRDFDYAIPYILHETAPVSMADYVKDLYFLTAMEKAKLIETDKLVNAEFDSLDKISNQINEAYDKMMQDNKDLFDEYDKILAENAELRHKADVEINDEQDGIADEIEYIKASTALTEEEKSLLIKDAEKLMKLDEKINEKTQEVEDSLKDLREQEEKIYNTIDEEENKNSDIWEKIDLTINKEPIPYTR